MLLTWTEMPAIVYPQLVPLRIITRLDAVLSAAPYRPLG